MNLAWQLSHQNRIKYLAKITVIEPTNFVRERRDTVKRIDPEIINN